MADLQAQNSIFKRKLDSRPIVYQGPTDDFDADRGGLGSALRPQWGLPRRTGPGCRRATLRGAGPDRRGAAARCYKRRSDLIVGERALHPIRFGTLTPWSGLERDGGGGKGVDT